MTLSRAALLAFLPLALAACGTSNQDALAVDNGDGGSSLDNGAAIDAANATNIGGKERANEAATPEARTDVAANKTANAALAPREVPEGGENEGVTDRIPPAFRGKWASSVADCTATDGTAKSLMAIGPDTIRYYEATATPRDIQEASSTLFIASFDMSGEGMRWKKTMRLTRAGDRITVNDPEQPVPFVYRRCP